VSKSYRFDSSAMLDLLDRTEHWHGEGSLDLIEVDYLVAAIRHYERAYANLLREQEELKAMIEDVARWVAAL
jgi:hypothetical protein